VKCPKKFFHAKYAKKEQYKDRKERKTIEQSNNGIIPEGMVSQK